MKEVELKDGERIDDLELSGLKIIQNKRGFCFGMDAVLLSGFVRANKNESIIDLGSGTGILPLLLWGKIHPKKIAGLEIQSESFDMAYRSVIMNDLEDEIEMVQGDIKEASSIFGRASFDIVTCNPPYIKVDSGIVNPHEQKAIARHEILCTFEDIARESRALLVSGGRLYLVHRPTRLAEIIAVLKEYRLEPKRIRMVHSFEDSVATLVLIESVSGGNTEMIVEKPLIIYKSPGEYSDEIKDIYGF